MWVLDGEGLEFHRLSADGYTSINEILLETVPSFDLNTPHPDSAAP
jgi:hypothetical protein